MNKIKEEKLKLKNKKLLELFVKKISNDDKEREYFKSMFSEVIENNVIPIELLKYVPISPEKAGKTRFDQLYDAAMYLIFPKYKTTTLESLIGPIGNINQEKNKIRIWRIMFPPKFELSHVLLRASSFQEAFSLGCDYACRMSLRIHKKIPLDLTLRVKFMTENAIRLMMDIRVTNQMQLHNQVKLIGREFTPTEINGARMVALGNPTQPEYSIVRYVEAKDLLSIFNSKYIDRSSKIEQEVFIKDDET